MLSPYSACATDAINIEIRPVSVNKPGLDNFKNLILNSLIHTSTALRKAWKNMPVCK
jgi:hypothetical protein